MTMTSARPAVAWLTGLGGVLPGSGSVTLDSLRCLVFLGHRHGEPEPSTEAPRFVPQMDVLSPEFVMRRN